MGTKNNPGKFDCYANAEPDEPMFVLLGRDPFAAYLVELWADVRALSVGDAEKIAEARSCAQAMRDYPITKKLDRKISVSDETHWEIVNAIVQDHICSKPEENLDAASKEA